MRNVPKTLIAVAAVLILGLTTVFAYPEWWHGTGQGTCYYGGETIRPFLHWQFEFESHPAQTNGIVGCWWDDDGHTACVWGIILRGEDSCEYVFSGYWDMYNPQLYGYPDGTFEVCVDSVDLSNWTLNGDWVATHDSLGGCYGNMSGHGHFTLPNDWYDCETEDCPP